MMKQKKDRRGGSKPQGPYHGKSRWLSTRITPGLRERLDRAAALSDRSLSQEIELIGNLGELEQASFEEMMQKLARTLRLKR